MLFFTMTNIFLWNKKKGTHVGFFFIIIYMKKVLVVGIVLSLEISKVEYLGTYLLEDLIEILETNMDWKFHGLILKIKHRRSK